MRSPVYRNLDRPFQIAGFLPGELIALSILFVAGGELAQSFGGSRSWAFALTLFAAVTTYCTHRIFGQLFVQRLLRFIFLPSFIRARLFASGKVGFP